LSNFHGTFTRPFSVVVLAGVELISSVVVEVVPTVVVVVVDVVHEEVVVVVVVVVVEVVLVEETCGISLDRSRGGGRHLTPSEDKVQF
jgi:type IV secretory pathway VirB3-like protein